MRRCSLRQARAQHATTTQQPRNNIHRVFIAFLHSSPRKPRQQQHQQQQPTLANATRTKVARVIYYEANISQRLAFALARLTTSKPRFSLELLDVCSEHHFRLGAPATRRAGEGGKQLRQTFVKKTREQLTKSIGPHSPYWCCDVF